MIATLNPMLGILEPNTIFSSSVEVKVGGCESFPVLIQTCQFHLRDISALHVCPKKSFLTFFNSLLEN